MLHDRTDEHVLAIAYGIHIDLNGTLKEVVDEHRMLGRDPYSLIHVPVQVVLVIYYLHGPSSQYIGGAHQHRVPDTGCHFPGPRFRDSITRFRLWNAHTLQHLVEPLPVLCNIHIFRSSAQDNGIQVSPA